MGKKLGITTLVVILLVVVGLFFINFAHKSKTTDGGTVTTPRQTDQPTASEQNAMMVTIKDFAFSPASITIKKGQSVTWTNQDDTRHDIKSDSDSPKGGLTSPLLSKGEHFTFTFNEVGTYKYHCTPHPFMQASVTVTE
jgi:amicyanin